MDVGGGIGMTVSSWLNVEVVLVAEGCSNVGGWGVVGG